VIGGIVLITTFFLAQFLAFSLVKPLKKLMLYADKVGQGSLDTPLVHNSSDEIGLLADNFYKMVQNIKSLTQSIYNEQNKKREYELRLLQAQINPHFLYNCLDNIITLIESKENQTAASMVHHLGRYYRLILSKGRNIITIKEELQLVRDYLEIQLIKNPDLFTYHIQVDECMEEYKIQKMILQPIMENSVIHGFSNTNIKGRIDIKLFTTNNDVIIVVKDNGRGISKSTLKQIFTPNELTMPKHFGLRNINERIQIKYGTQYGLSVTSSEGLNTITTITFPKLL
jgi:two-component system sensor histidine kinase YesM